MNAPNLRDEIFKGCTRPAMLFGVPIVPFVVTVGAILIAGMWTFIVSSAAAMIVLSLMIPALFAMRMVTRSDDQRLRQRFMALRMRLSQRNGKFWGASSYSPTRTKKRKSGEPASKFEAEAAREVMVADFVPYSSHLTDTVIRTREGDYLRLFRLEGIPFESADPMELLARHEGFNSLVRSFATGNVALWSHRIGRQVADRFDSQYANERIDEVARNYYDGLEQYRMMARDQYLAVIYRPVRSKVGRALKRGGLRTLETIREDERAAIKVLDDVGRDVMASLKRYKPEPLATYQHNGRTFSRALEFLGYLVNGVWERVPVPSGKISDALPTSRLFFGGEKLEIRTSDGRRRYGVMLDLKDYPENSEPGMLNGLLYGQFDYIETQSFSILDRASAKDALERQRGHLIASEDAASSQIAAMHQALNDLINGTFVLGEYHYSLAVFGDTPAEAERAASTARAILQEAGFQAAMVDLVADSAWFAQLPANWRYRPREAKLSSRNFCGLSCFHNFPSGKRNGNPWGEAIAILKSPSGQPVYLNCHVTPEDQDSFDRMALAHTVLIGQAGSGKTALEMFILIMLTKYGASIALYDKDRGCEIAIRWMGGTYLVMKRGDSTELNPFWLDPTPQNVDFWARLVTKLVERPNRPLRTKDETDIWTAVSAVAGMPREVRRLSMVWQLLPKDGEDSLHERLAKWCRPGKLGWVLDNATDKVAASIANCKIFGFDDTDLIDDPEIAPIVTMTMLHYTDLKIDGNRFVVVLAEFWKRLQSDVYTAFAEDMQRTGRKENTFAIYDTQSPSEVIASRAAKALIGQMATEIYLPNPKADEKDYIDGFKLTRAEFDIVRSLGENSRRFLVKQGSRSFVATLDLSGLRAGDGDAIDILSGSKDNVELLDDVRQEVGDDPQTWLPVFQRRLAERRAMERREKYLGRAEQVSPATRRA
ncbi:VirB4 family type IV secretion/conjugal transfer ATPase [Burkholderia pyrrocinia]|uniref:VirB4 family type IV secretion/conjugal transfer ATPase n=1 Tax=Burkholderia pyrrocinia TaxID=60550 RepID=UPI001BCC313B|nr:VirB4 family type IV secretion/conjugal transfer ATPase [Burkholderia pyrrocinia]QVN18977.1 VirB4 family type IV secretion/conjugal transfer ATPase [Burkholderia pyrrocinia]